MLLLKISVTIILLGLILWQLGGVSEVVAMTKSMHPSFIALILLVNTADRALMTFKWTRLIRGKGIQIPFFFGMKIYCASMIWGLFLPATMGADAIRAFRVSRAGLDLNEVVASIIVERMVGFIAALLVGVFSVMLLFSFGILHAQFHFLWWVGATMVVVATVGFVASLSENVFDLVDHRLFRRLPNSRIMNRLKQIHSTYRSYHNEKGSLATFFGLTFTEQLVPILQAWLVALGLGIDVSFLVIAGVVPLASLTSRIPISLDGLGVFEGVFLLLALPIGISAPEAVAISLGARVLQLVSCVPWWIACVIDGASIRPPRAIREQV